MLVSHLGFPPSATTSVVRQNPSAMQRVANGVRAFVTGSPVNNVRSASVNPVWRSRSGSANLPVMGSLALVGATFYSAAAHATDAASAVQSVGLTDALIMGGLGAGFIYFVMWGQDLVANWIEQSRLPKSSDELRKTVEANDPSRSFSALRKLLKDPAADLKGINLSGLRLDEYLDLRGRDLTEAKFISATLGRFGGKHPPATGTRAHFENTNLTRANFTGALVKSGSFNNANLTAAVLNGANLSSSRFLSATLDGASLRGANLQAADFSGASLRGADLRGASFSNPQARPGTEDWYTAKLQGADLAEADLRGAILPLSCAGIVFAGAKITGLQARYITSRGGSVEGARIEEVGVPVADMIIEDGNAVG